MIRFSALDYIVQAQETWREIESKRERRIYTGGNYVFLVLDWDVRRDAWETVHYAIA